MGKQGMLKQKRMKREGNKITGQVILLWLIEFILHNL